jgi:hypothetical protein
VESGVCQQARETATIARAGRQEDVVSSELEIIDAFIDGQRVDGAAIKRALADPEGRAYLVDAWLLREGDSGGRNPCVVRRESTHRAIRETRTAMAGRGGDHGQPARWPTRQAVSPAARRPSP